MLRQANYELELLGSETKRAGLRNDGYLLGFYGVNGHLVHLHCIASVFIYTIEEEARWPL